jgi:glycine cleavage system aminomethyltransferase T
MDVAPGRIVYTQMLNHKGGIESDLTVTRLSETAFFLVVPGATLQRDLAWLRRTCGRRVRRHHRCHGGGAVLCVMGPKARELMQKVSPNDFSNAHHPFGTAREIEIGMGLARAHRVTYVGELGWELYVSTDQTAHVFEALEEAGADVGLKLCGLAYAGQLPHRKGLPPFRP